MDPDKAWQLLVRAAETWTEHHQGDDDQQDTLCATDMADLVLALNNWAKMGGYPPSPFRKPASEL